MNIQHLRNIRIYELTKVMPLMPKGSYVLEVGAGAGWQASLLSQKGFSVEAIDIKQSGYNKYRVWPVQHYDGIHIPFGDDSFDVVFSSNVLEHVPHIEKLQSEIRRVLKPGGIAIHILPTGTWRFWTNVSFYLFCVRQFLLMLFRKPYRKNCDRNGKACRLRKTEDKQDKPSIKNKFKHALIPSGHGATGNCVSQVYLFSRFCWMRTFRRTGWSVMHCLPNRLFYTGHLLCGSKLNVPMRHAMSYVLGSSCLMYVLTKN